MMLKTSFIASGMIPGDFWSPCQFSPPIRSQEITIPLQKLPRSLNLWKISPNRPMSKAWNLEQNSFEATPTYMHGVSLATAGNTIGKYCTCISAKQAHVSKFLDTISKNLAKVQSEVLPLCYLPTENTTERKARNRYMQVVRIQSQEYQPLTPSIAPLTTCWAATS